MKKNKKRTVAVGGVTYKMIRTKMHIGVSKIFVWKSSEDDGLYFADNGLDICKIAYAIMLDVKFVPDVRITKIADDLWQIEDNSYYKGA